MQQLIRSIASRVPTSRKALLLGLAGLITIGAIGYAVFDSQQSTNNSPKSSRPTFPNYLKPNAELKVGDKRYVSAYQVLTLETVEEIYGEMGAEATVVEEFYDSNSTPTSSFNRTIETSCRYSGSPVVVLFTEQYFDSEDLDPTVLESALYPIGDNKLDEKIRLYEEAIKSSDDKSLKEFVDALKKSAQVYSAQTESRDLDAAAIDTRDFVLPVDRGLFAFNVVHGTVVYRLNVEVKEDPDDEYKLSHDEIRTHLKKAQEALQNISSNATNGSLDQSPAPTILGNTNRHGDSTILEPRALLTKPVYESVIGISQNEAVRRQTVVKDISKEKLDGSKTPMLPNNTCERKGRSGDTATSVNFELKYGKFTEDVNRRIEKGFKIDGKDKIVQSDADWMGIFVLNDAATSEYAVFRIGSYYGTVSILNTSSKGLSEPISQKGGTEQQYTQFVNAITAAIKKQ